VSSKNLKQKPKWRLGFVARSCYCASFRWRARPCVWCVAIRVHALGAFPCAGMHARPCGAVPRRVDVSRHQKLLAHCSSLSASLLWSPFLLYCVSFRPRARPWGAVRDCAPMHLNSRPCGSVRAHASFSGSQAASWEAEVVWDWRWSDGRSEPYDI